MRTCRVLTKKYQLTTVHVLYPTQPLQRIMFSDPLHVRSREALINGYVRQSLSGDHHSLLPVELNRLCLRYNQHAFRWTVKDDVLQYLLSSDDAMLDHDTMQMPSFTFHLGLRRLHDSIVFTVFPCNAPQQQTKKHIYCELYCVETQTQYKRAHLFVIPPRCSSLYHCHYFLQFTQSGKLSPCEWSNHHLTVQQCHGHKQLTFCAHLTVLDDTECDYGYQHRIMRPFAVTDIRHVFRFQYTWQLDRFYRIPCNPQCKVYSPNFAHNSFCLWYRNLQSHERSTSLSNKNDEAWIVIGLQLLKLSIQHRKKGFLFTAKVRLPSKPNTIEFVYHLDLNHSDLDIVKIPKVPWVTIEIDVDLS
mmetsp:Transcript_18393/g.29156  ORF Transcript_18393/g.29156 Transcript_18393/m.29156 type:complete len:359 (-) Transcript_18393:97-1173(-)